MLSEGKFLVLSGELGKSKIGQSELNMMIGGKVSALGEMLYRKGVGIECNVVFVGFLHAVERSKCKNSLLTVIQR